MKIHFLKPKMFLIYFFMLITALDGLIIPTLVAGIINSVESKSLNSLLYYFLFGIVGYFIIRSSLYFWNIYQQKFIKEFNLEYKRNSIIKFFSGSNSAKKSSLTSFIINDFKYLETNYIKSFFLFIYCVAFSIISAIYVLVIDYKLGLLFVLFSMFPVITPKIYKNIIKSSTDKWTNTTSNFIEKINEYFNGLSTIRIFKKQTLFTENLILNLSNMEYSNYQMQKYLLQSNWITNLISGLSSFIPLFIGGIFVINNELSLASLMAVYLASDRIVIPAVNAIDNYNKLKSSRSIRDKYDSMLSSLDEEYNIQSKKISSILPIELSNVSFNYSSTTVFNDISLKVQKGDHILIQGSSGSGKTTLFKLLLLMTHPDKGSIKYNETPAEKLNSQTLMDHIGYFEQDPFIFNESILFNITLGDSYNENEVMRVIHKCKLSDLVESRGLSYDVGLNGENISGGQKMRIALARLLIRKTSLIFLDEFSAGLDKKNANMIRDIIHKEIETVVEITHEENVDYSIYSKLITIDSGFISEG